MSQWLKCFPTSVRKGVQVPMTYATSVCRSANNSSLKTQTQEILGASRLAIVISGFGVEL